LDVRRCVVRHRVSAVLCAVALVAAVSVVAAPGVSARPVQEDPSSGSGAGEAAQRGVLDIDVDVANDDAATVAEALGDLSSNVADQLAQLRDAQGAVDAALLTLAARDAAVADTQMRIEELTDRPTRW
jgi:hypothetical protein